MKQDHLKSPSGHDPSAEETPHISGRRVDIPDHELLRCIGRGSYGEVWLARNMMGTYRAVKNPLRVENGYVTMPEKPGLGVDLDWGVIQADTEVVI